MLSKTQVVSQLSIRFKHLKLEVDKQKIVNQLTSSDSNSNMHMSAVSDDNMAFQSYSEEVDDLS